MNDVIKQINDKLANGWVVDNYTIKYAREETHLLTIKNGVLPVTFQAETQEKVLKLASNYAVATKGKPSPFPNPDWSSVIDAANDFLVAFEKDEAYDKHWIFQAAMEAIYGPEIWEWMIKVAK